jgi:hypothetical protein
MKRFKVQKIIVCEVSVWGYVEANNMPDAMMAAVDVSTGCGMSFDHEIISDVKTITIEIKEDSK